MSEDPARATLDPSEGPDTFLWKNSGRNDIILNYENEINFHVLAGSLGFDKVQIAAGYGVALVSCE